MKHVVFIINPNSGVDRRKHIRQTLDDTLDFSQYSYEIKFTKFAKHGTHLAREAAANKAFAVVAVGGDGSVNDVAKGLLGTETALAIIPKGSGNGMARSLSIPLNVRRALHIINAGRTLEMDIGYANDEVFISNAGAGFDSLISHAFATSKARGFKTYSWLITKHLWAFKPLRLQIKIDGKEFTENAFMVSVANGTQLGYNFKIAPQASWTDGLLDIVIIKKFPKILGGGIALRALHGSITQSPFVKHFRAKEAFISSPDLHLMQTDGDAHPCSTSVHFRVAPAALKVIVP